MESNHEIPKNESGIFLSTGLDIISDYKKRFARRLLMSYSADPTGQYRNAGGLCRENPRRYQARRSSDRTSE